MKTTEKELKVLNKMYELGGERGLVHYSKLIDTIFNEDVIKKYKLSKLNKMATSYLGKMCNKNLICSGYDVVNNYAYYVGHSLLPDGLSIVNKC